MDGSARHTARAPPHDPAARLAWQTEPPKARSPGQGGPQRDMRLLCPLCKAHTLPHSLLRNVEHGSRPRATSPSEPVCHLQERMVLSSSGMFNALGPGQQTTVGGKPTKQMTGDSEGHRAPTCSGKDSKRPCPKARPSRLRGPHGLPTSALAPGWRRVKGPSGRPSPSPQGPGDKPRPSHHELALLTWIASSMKTTARSKLRSHRAAASAGREDTLGEEGSRDAHPLQDN